MRFHIFLPKFVVWNVAEYCNFLAASLQSASHSHNSVNSLFCHCHCFSLDSLFSH